MVRNKKGQFVKGCNLKKNSPRYNLELHIQQEVLCACGCGKKITVKLIDIKPEDRHKKRFVRGHNLRVLTKEQKNKLYTKMSKTRRNNGIRRLTPIYRLIKESLEYKNWRTSVFKRDAYTCQKCGATKKYLNAHHIKPFSYLYKEAMSFTDSEIVWQTILEYIPLFDVDNGITYCQDCHYKVEHPHYNRWRKNPPKKKLTR